MRPHRGAALIIVLRTVFLMVLPMAVRVQTKEPLSVGPPVTAELPVIRGQHLLVLVITLPVVQGVMGLDRVVLAGQKAIPALLETARKL